MGLKSISAQHMALGPRLFVLFFFSFAIKPDLLLLFFSKLERKRHIGNDIVNLVFLDGTPEEMAAFSPNCIKSQFTRITYLLAYIFMDIAYSVVSH